MVRVRVLRQIQHKQPIFFCAHWAFGERSLPRTFLLCLRCKIVSSRIPFIPSFPDRNFFDFIVTSTTMKRSVDYNNAGAACQEAGHRKEAWVRWHFFLIRFFVFPNLGINPRRRFAWFCRDHGPMCRPLISNAHTSDTHDIRPLSLSTSTGTI